jgi:hypothetical protein
MAPRLGHSHAWAHIKTLAALTYREAPGLRTRHGVELRGRPVLAVKAGPMGNSTDEVRRVIAVIYFEDGAALYDQIEGSQRIGYDVYFSDPKPGDVAGSDLMPVLCSG